MMCLGVFLFGSNFFGTLWASWASWKSPLPDQGSSPSLFVHISFQFLACSLLFLPLGVLKVVPEVPQPLLIFLNSCFFILFQLDVYFFLLFQIIALSPGFLPVTVDSLNILLYFICFFIFQPSSISSVSILITSVLNSASDILSISSLLSSFSGVLICSFIWAIFLCAPIML